jgi:hypothetical protein
VSDSYNPRAASIHSNWLHDGDAPVRRIAGLHGRGDPRATSVIARFDMSYPINHHELYRTHSVRRVHISRPEPTAGAGFASLCASLIASLLASLAASLALTALMAAAMAVTWHRTAIAALIFAFTFLVVIGHATLFGMPRFLIGRSREWISLASCVFSGIAVGALPIGVLTWPAQAGFAVDGWSAYLQPLLYFGMFRALGGLVFWTILICVSPH